MDHSEAVRLRAAERYVLQQLTAVEAEAFEEHFFSCPECAEEVRWISMFEENARKAVKAREMSAELALLAALQSGVENVVLLPEHTRQVIFSAASKTAGALVASLLSASGVSRFSLPVPAEREGPVQIAVKATDLDPGAHVLRLTAEGGAAEEFPILIRID